MIDSQSHYFSAKPETPSNRKEISVRFGGIDFAFITDNGVFSKTHADFGSELLIDTFTADRKNSKADGDRILDLGCGYGLVGIVLKRLFPEIDITMTDINSRAIGLAKMNSVNNHVKFANILESDVLSSIVGKFDIILTNPPIRAGKATVFKFYNEAYEHLDSGGLLYVVIQKKQGAPSSESKLKELFGSCEIVAKSAGYWVLRSIKI